MFCFAPLRLLEDGDFCGHPETGEGQIQVERLEAGINQEIGGIQEAVAVQDGKALLFI